DLVHTSAEFLAASWAAAASGGVAPVDLGAASLRTLDDARAAADARRLPWWSVTPFGAEDPDAVSSSFQAAPTYRGDLDRALADVRQWTRDGWLVSVVFDGHGSAQRAVERLLAAEVPARLVA